MFDELLEPVYRVFVTFVYIYFIKFIYIGKKKYTIYTQQLVITNQEQTICLDNFGIMLITDDDFYKSTNRSNIYIHITLFNK